MAVQPIPPGYHTITPYLIVNNGAAALDFYKKAFNAQELMRMDHGGKIGHAEVQIGDSRLMLADEFPEMGAKSPATIGGTPTGLCLYVQDCDKLFNQAVNAGAKIERPLENQFYGDRSGTVIDPFGHKWTIATHIEDLTPEQISERMASWSQQQQQ